MKKVTLVIIVGTLIQFFGFSQKHRNEASSFPKTTQVGETKRGKEKAIISFIFDDLNATDQAVFDIFQEFELIPSYALVSSKLNADNVEIYQNLHALGASIISHTKDNIRLDSSVTVEEAEYQLKESRKKIESYGMICNGFQPVQSVIADEFVPIVQKYYDFAFCAKDPFSYDKNVAPTLLTRYGLETNIINHDLTTVKSRIEDAITNKQLLVLYGHQIPSTYTNEDGSSRITVNDLRSLLQYVKSKQDSGELLCLPTDLAINLYYQQEHANVNELI